MIRLSATSLLLRGLALGGLVGAAAFASLMTPGVSPWMAQGDGSAQLPKDPLEPLLAPATEIVRLYRSLSDGKNEVLALVDGVPITVESIKSELGENLDTAVTTEMTLDVSVGGRLTRERAEARVIMRAVRQTASSAILRKTAEEFGFRVSDAMVDARLDSLKEARGIARDDLKAWAEYTIETFGQTPLKFRQTARLQMMEFQSLQIMAGDYGPIRGLTLPVFFPLEVAPSELKEEYERTKDQWRILTDVDYTLIAVGLPPTTGISSRTLVDSTLRSARERLKEESIEAVEAFVRTEVQRVADTTPEVRTFASVKVANDRDLDGFGGNVRGMRPGEVKGVLPQRADDLEWRFIIRLNSATVGVSREFSDVVVQRRLDSDIRQRKSYANQQRVREALLQRAVIVPQSVMGQ